MAGVATRTNTLVDSGCKHIIAVRLSMDTMLHLSKTKDTNIFLRDKMKYSANRNDILLCVNRSLTRGDHGKTANNNAYPSVVSNLGDISDDTMQAIKDYYHTGQVPSNIYIPDFHFMGFCLGLAHVHTSAGDNVVSSMVGGMVTTQNGAFPIRAGDKIMWYFQFEEDNFDKKGRRIAQNNARPVDEGAQQRLKTFRRENGAYGIPTDAHTAKNNIALPKPFMFSSPQYEVEPRAAANDWMRVFGKAVSNARAYDKVDIMICTEHYVRQLPMNMQAVTFDSPVTDLRQQSMQYV